VANPIVGNPVTFPQRTQPLVDESQVITPPWYLLLQAFFDRTGAGTGEVTLTTQLAVVDAGGGQAGAAQLTRQYNTVVGAGGGVALPTYTAGKPCVVVNVGGGNVTVYPPAGPGAQIDALGANVGYVLAHTKCQVFWFESATQIRSTQLG
jgi:hypothetical protein